MKKELNVINADRSLKMETDFKPEPVKIEKEAGYDCQEVRDILDKFILCSIKLRC